MAAYEERKEQFAELGVSLYAASSQSLEHAERVVAGGVSYPVAYGVSRKEANALGAWWQEERGYIQPSEFILARDGSVLGAMYASGPIGRMQADETLRFITNRERRRLEQEAGTG